MKRFMPSDFSTVSLYSLAAKGIQLVVAVWLIRVLSVEHYADYTVFFTFSSTILGVSGQSLALAYVRYNTEKLTEGRGEHKDWLVVLSHALNALSFICYIFVAYALADALKVSSSILLAAAIYGFFLGALQLNIAFLQSRECYVRAGRLENLKQLVLLAVVSLAIVGFSASLTSILVSYCAAGLLTLLFSGFYLRSVMSGGVLAFRADRRQIRAFVSVSIWIILYSATTQLVNQANVLMLSAYGTQSDVAEYGVASRYYTMALLLLPAMKTVMRVRMSKAEMVRSTRRQGQFLVRWIKKTVLVFLALTVFLGLFAELAFPVLNGSRYVDAIAVFQILLIGALAAYVLAPSSALIMSLNRFKTQLGISLFALGLNLVGNYWLIPEMGASGAAIATTVSQTTLNVLMTVVVLRMGTAGNGAHRS